MNNALALHCGTTVLVLQLSQGCSQLSVVCQAGRQAGKETGLH